MGSYSGVIKRVHEKDGRMSFLMDNDEWYGLGHDKKEGAAEGDTAKMEYEMNGKYKNVIKGTCFIQKGKGKAGSGGGSNYAQKEKYWADKELRDIDTQKKISFSGAMNTATSMATCMIAADLLKLGGKKADAWNAFEAFINDLAETIYVRIQNAPEFHEELMSHAESSYDEAPDGLEDEGPNTDGDSDEGNWE